MANTPVSNPSKKSFRETEREKFNKSLKEPGAPQDYTFEDYELDCLNGAIEILTEENEDLKRSIVKRRFTEVKQHPAGGKYGIFVCPECGGQGDYKFTQSSGGCHECGTLFFLSDGLDLVDSKIGKFGTHFIQLDQ